MGIQDLIQFFSAPPNCDFGLFLCKLGIDRFALFGIVLLLWPIWFFFRKFQYEAYARKKYPGLNRKQRIFRARTPFDYMDIHVEDLRRRYFRYSMEVFFLFFLSVALLFVL